MPKKNKTKRRNNRRKNKQQTVMVVQPGWIAPKSVEVELTYASLANILQAGGHATASRRYNPCNAYDVDPLLGSTSMSGFSEWGALFNEYRVLKSTIMICAVNDDAFPTLMYVCPINFDPGSNYATPQTLISNPNCKHHMFGLASGAEMWRHSHHVTSARMLGLTEQQTRVCTELRGTTSGGVVPVNPWFWQVGIDGSANLVNGVWCQVQIKTWVLFQEVNTPST